ncbi:MAG: polysaccharide biosynthesis protein [Pseudomonadales bacterium]|nr:polysaccharide biosynthesis protein [Pseudomonadales bacterium]
MLINTIINLPRNAKRALALSADLILIPLTLWLAFCLRLEQLYLPDLRVTTVIVLTTLSTVTIFVRLGLYRAVIRFVGYQVLNSIFVGASISVITLAFLGFLLQAHLPRSVPFIYFGLLIISVGGTRLLLRSILNQEMSTGHENVVIYGAGASGRQLATALLQGSEYNPVAFLDDDPQKQKTVVNGLQVYKPRHLKQLMADRTIHQVFLAITQLQQSRKTEILSFLTQYDIRVQAIPGFAEIASGKAKIEEIRQVEVEDLLGRDAVVPDAALLSLKITGRTVLVSGAGGSIGSELCRQIAGLVPRSLILFESSEFALYSIEQELRQKYPETRIVALVGSVQDELHLRKVFSELNIDTVYHAAAYKHVPIVEHNLVSGIRNNFLGTFCIARIAMEYKTKNFVLISTDKAVRPTNFMGATKRLAELSLQALASTQPETIFSMVRFGNVLGSSGSVVPLFKQQITAGGPVTVTHPEVTRYFMTIPEAVQLVIQSSSMARGGDVFVLDMGEPVQIVQLAKTMIHLMGKTIKDAEGNGEIEIRFTGLRPGEKLYEELLIGENCVGTDHPMITRAQEDFISYAELLQLVERVRSDCDSFAINALTKVFETYVSGYKNPGDLVDYLRQRKPGSDNIVNLNQ